LQATDNNLVSIGDTMYYISLKNEMEVCKKVVVGAEEANQIFWDFHASAHGDHCGTQKN
jgi:hypothetical protein